jgi:hypothetical protein
VIDLRTDCPADDRLNVLLTDGRQHWATQLPQLLQPQGVRAIRAECPGPRRGGARADADPCGGGGPEPAGRPGSAGGGRRLVRPAPTPARRYEAARRQETRPGRQGHPRPVRAQRDPRKVLRLPDRHQGRRDRRQGDRTRRRLREHGRPDGQGSRVSKTSDVAGDGTTTATIYAEAIFTEGLKNVTAGANPMAVKRGIDKAVAARSSKKLASMSKVKVADSKEIARSRHHAAPTRTPRSARSSPRRWTRSARTA